MPVRTRRCRKRLRPERFFFSPEGGRQKTPSNEDGPGLDAKEARNRALSWLARREYGRQELIRKLVQRGCAEEDATRIVAVLTAEGSVSDERFIEALLHVRRVRGYGPLYIRRELEEKGIDRRHHRTLAGRRQPRLGRGREAGE